MAKMFAVAEEQLVFAYGKARTGKRETDEDTLTDRK